MFAESLDDQLAMWLTSEIWNCTKHWGNAADAVKINIKPSRITTARINEAYEDWRQDLEKQQDVRNLLPPSSGVNSETLLCSYKCTWRHNPED